MGNKAPRRHVDYAVACHDIEEQSKTCTPVFRKRICEDELIDNFDEEYTTIYELFKDSVKKYGENRCLGEIVREEGKQPKYSWLTYNEVHDLVQRTAKLIQKHDLGAGELNFISISGPNNNAWMIIDLAINLLGFTSVPFYQALGGEAVISVLEETQVTSLFGSATDLIKISKLQNTCEVTTLVCFDTITEELKEAAKDFKLIDYWAEIHSEEIELHHPIPPMVPPNKSSIYTVSYTSGTTGRPKGAMISNGNMLSALRNLAHVCAIEPTDTYLSYLPLAHIMGRIGNMALMTGGGSIGSFGGNIKKIVQDSQLLKPTIFAAVPRVINRVYDTIIGRVEASSFIKRNLFKRALQTKVANLRLTGNYKHKLYDGLVFNKVKNLLGGNIRTMFVSSAPVTPQVLEFARVAFQCNVIEAYGQTESSGSSFATVRNENRTGYVGGPTVGTEYKLESVQELDYLVTDQPYPRGEILIRGPGVFKGYFKQPEKTREAIDEDGWLHTGDIGAILQKGALKIIDRKKNIFKLSQGEYIAPQKIEGIMTNCLYISQIFVYGDSLKDHIVAIIIPDEANVMELAKQKKWEGDFATICQSELLHKQLQEQMAALAKLHKLNSLEQVGRNFVTDDTPWTDADLLTPSMKLKRHVAKEKYQSAIEKLYGA